MTNWPKLHYSLHECSSASGGFTVLVPYTILWSKEKRSKEQEIRKEKNKSSKRKDKTRKEKRQEKTRKEEKGRKERGEK